MFGCAPYLSFSVFRYSRARLTRETLNSGHSVMSLKSSDLHSSRERARAGERTAREKGRRDGARQEGAGEAGARPDRCFSSMNCSATWWPYVNLRPIDMSCSRSCVHTCHTHAIHMRMHVCEHAWVHVRPVQQVLGDVDAVPVDGEHQGARELLRLLRRAGAVLRVDLGPLLGRRVEHLDQRAEQPARRAHGMRGREWGRGGPWRLEHGAVRRSPRRRTWSTSRRSR